jgi:transposase
MSRFGFMNDIHHIIHPLQAQPAHGPLWVKRYTGDPATSSAMPAIGTKAEVNSEYWLLRHRPVRVDGAARDVIQAPKLEARIMRYELSDYEWTAIKQMLPNKPRGVRRVNDRRVLNGIFWVLRSGAPWRDLPESYGPRTTCYNRFVRWRQAGVWDQIMDALATGHDPAVQMIDTSVVRVHQHGACIANNNHQDMGRSRGGLTSKIHAVVDTNGLPVRCADSRGSARQPARRQASISLEVGNNAAGRPWL